MCKKELIQQKNFGKRMPNEVGKPECSCLGVHNKYLGDDKGALPLEMQIELASYYRRRWVCTYSLYALFLLLHFLIQLQ